MNISYKTSEFHLKSIKNSQKNTNLEQNCVKYVIIIDRNSTSYPIKMMVILYKSPKFLLKSIINDSKLIN